MSSIRSHRLRAAWQRRRGDDRGVVAGSDILIFGVLAFVMGSLLIINVWAVIDTAFATSAASRESARIFVESDDEGAAVANAERRAQEVMAGYGKSDGPVVAMAFAGFERCEVVTVTVSYDVPLVQLPIFGSFGSLTTIDSSHSERVDAYRSGEFEGECDL